MHVTQWRLAVKKTGRGKLSNHCGAWQSQPQASCNPGWRGGLVATAILSRLARILIKSHAVLEAASGLYQTRVSHSRNDWRKGSLAATLGRQHLMLTSLQGGEQ